MRFSPRAQGLVAALVTVTIWTAFIVIARASAQRTLTPFDIAFLRIVGASLVLLLVQLALGAWLSANFAGLGCATADGCMPGRGIGDAFWYLRELALDGNGRVIADPATAANLIAHRIGAALAVPLLLLAAVVAARASVTLRRNALLVLALVSLQAMLGLCALVFSLPLAVVLAHSTVAALLLLAMLRLDYLTGGAALI